MAACFRMFPKRFCLNGYEDWPDTNYIQIRLFDCRRNGFLKGDPANGFEITNKGKKQGLETGQKLKTGIFKPVQGHEKLNKRTRENRIIRILMETEAFKKYKKNNLEKLNEFEFRNLLQCTMSSSEKILNDHYKELQHNAEEIDDKKKSEETKKFLSMVHKLGKEKKWVK